MIKRVLSVSFFVAFFFSLAIGQDLQLERAGKLTKISVGHFIKVVICQDEKIEEEDCKLLTYIGKLEKYNEEQILISPIQKNLNEKNDEVISFQEFQYAETNTNVDLVSIPVSEIYYVSSLGKTRKINNRLTNRNVTGGLLIFTGITTGLSSLLVKDKTDRKKLLVAAAAEFGLGIVLISLGNKKKYYLQSRSGKEQVWSVAN